MAAAVYVAVVGTGDASADLEAIAEEVGRRLADAGAITVCGGLGGVMAATARGAARAGGTVVGLLPGTDRRDANPDLTVALPTGLGEARNALIVRAADAVIAIGGAYGTLSEIAFALKLAVPVVGLRTWDLAQDGVPVQAFPQVTTAEDAVATALASTRG